MAKKIKQRIANAFGYDLIRRTKNQDSFEAHFLNIVKKHGINCVIDVGANCGQYGQKLRGLGYKGRISSFEPASENFEALKDVIGSDSEWQVYHTALGASAGELELNVFKASVLTSFLNPTEELKEMFQSDNKSDIESREKVSVNTLSAHWNQITNGIDTPRVMLKMDTQGFDLEVFKGAMPVMDKISVLQSELSAVSLYEGMPDYITALGQYRSAGFEISGVFPVSRNLKDLRIVEFDCVLVRPL